MAPLRGFDPIGLVEQAYAPQADTQAWLMQMAPVVTASFDRDGYGAGVYVCAASGPETVLWSSPPESPIGEELPSKLATEGLSGVSQERFVRALMMPGATSWAQADLDSNLFPDAPVELQDAPGVVVPNAEGRTVVFFSFTRKPVWMDAASRMLWQRLAIHLGAGFRIAGRADDPEADDVEAVLEPNGALLHGRGEACATSNRERLRDAATKLDKARCRAGRADPHAALEVWQGLLAGRWSLVDHFDSDGRKFLLARRNDPTVPSPVPRTLSRRQGQVVFLASLGWSLKEVAYALGVSTSTVSGHLSASLESLGIRSRAELVRIATELTLAAHNAALPRAPARSS
jgi:DNA-binding CsgD family transcriptional regulator